MVSLRVKTRNSANKVDSRHKNEEALWEDAPHPVDRRRFSKTTLLKLPNMRRERVTVPIFPKMLIACRGLISLICTSRKFSFCGILWLVPSEIEMGTL